MNLNQLNELIMHFPSLVDDELVPFSSSFNGEELDIEFSVDSDDEYAIEEIITVVSIEEIAENGTVYFKDQNGDERTITFSMQAPKHILETFLTIN